jgi:bacterial leucyl aminopeptidase
MKKNIADRIFSSAALLFAGLLASGCASVPQNNKTWITVGEAALVKLQEAAPQVQARHSHVLKSEKVHLVQVDDEEMRKLGTAIHLALKLCGGYMVHASEAEGRATLERMQTGVATPVRPAYNIDQQALVVPILEQMHESNIAQTIGEMAAFVNRYYTTAAGSEAANWLAQKWAGIAAGRGDISVTRFAHSGYPQASVIASIAGSDNADEVVVIGGHLDSIAMGGVGENTRAPGADDDASGIASMTEALRAMVASGYKPRRTIRFIGYAAEEVGLRGSQAIAKEYKANKVNVVGVMQLDMTNYKGSASDIYIYTDYTDSLQNEFLANLIGAYLPGVAVGYDKCRYGCSDHVSWTAQGYPASLPFEAAFRQDNPTIHSARDTYANSGNQAAHALKFARLAAAYAVELGGDGM